MDFGSIISFVAIIVISSLVNKGNKTTKPQSQPNKPGSSQRSTTTIGSNPAQRSTVKKSNSINNRRTTFTGGLEDLFKELKVEFEKNFKEQGKKEVYSNAKQDKKIQNSTDDHSTKRILETTHKNNSNADKSSIYTKEIGKEELPIEFNRKSIIQGVIMSEILQKPKSLRR